MLHKSFRENNATKQIAEQLIYFKKANALKTTCCNVKIMFRYFAQILGYVKMHFHSFLCLSVLHVFLCQYELIQRQVYLTIIKLH